MYTNKRTHTQIHIHTHRHTHRHSQWHTRATPKSRKANSNTEPGWGWGWWLQLRGRAEQSKSVKSAKAQVDATSRQPAVPPTTALSLSLPALPLLHSLSVLFTFCFAGFSAARVRTECQPVRLPVPNDCASPSATCHCSARARLRSCSVRPLVHRVRRVSWQRPAR